MFPAQDRFTSNRRLIVRLVLAVATSNFPAVSSGENPHRYLAKTSRGDLITGNQIANWHSEKGEPTLDGVPILQPQSPIRWLIDRYPAPVEIAPAFVEMVGGDRLPGIATAHNSGNGDPLQPVPEHLVIRSDAVQLTAAATETANFRVDARFVRRIVWRRRSRDRYEPRKVFLRTGGTITFRSYRFRSDRLEVLLDRGRQSIPFNEIAEVHLPAVDSWDSYFAAISTLCADSEPVCQQIETTAGIRLTASLERFLAVSIRDADDPAGWIHGFQPAWSLDLLWIPHHRIHVRRFWHPANVPLTSIEPAAVVQQSSLDERPLWHWTRNSTVHGAPPQTAAGSFSYGFGCHGDVTLEFPVPSDARGFRTHAALDRGNFPARVETILKLGDGQVATPVTLSERTPCLESKLHFAADSSGRSRILSLTSRPVPRANSDPRVREIGSSMHWGDPVIELDRSLLTDRLRSKAADRINAWQDWEHEVPADAIRKNVLVSADGQPRFRLCFAAPQTPIVLSRQIAVGENASWLRIDATAVGRLSEGGTAAIEVRCGDLAPIHKELSPKDSANRQPIWIALAPVGRDRPTSIEVRMLPSSPATPVLWHALEVAGDRQEKTRK